MLSVFQASLNQDSKFSEDVEQEALFSQRGVITLTSSSALRHLALLLSRLLQAQDFPTDSGLKFFFNFKGFVAI